MYPLQANLLVIVHQGPYVFQKCMARGCLARGCNCNYWNLGRRKCEGYFCNYGGCLSKYFKDEAIWAH